MAKSARTVSEYTPIYIGPQVTAFNGFSTDYSASENGTPKTDKGFACTPYSVNGNTTEDFVAQHRTYGADVLVSGANILSSMDYRVPSGFFNSGDVVSARNRAIENSTRRAEALAAVSLAEGQKTIDMVVGLVRRFFSWLAGIYSSLRRFQIKELFDIGSEIWLEYRYGWLPLLGDIDNYSKAFEKMRSTGIFTSFGSDVQNSKEFSTSTYHQYANTKVFNLDHTVFLSHSGVKSGFTYYLEEGSQLFDRVGLHFKSILNSAWELIPFSFIIDWFLDLGSLLAAWTAPPLVPYNSYDTYFKEYTVVSTLRNENYYVAQTPTTVTQSVKSFTRTLPLNQHTYEWNPGYALNWAQLTDISAILYSLCRQIKTFR